jgi:protein-ribulosamine 3-kinase
MNWKKNCPKNNCIPLEDLPFILDSIAESSGKPLRFKNISPVSGGCINQCFKIEGVDSSCVFLKKNRKSFLPFFKAEAQALREIKATDTVQVPQVISFGESESSSFLVLEFLTEGRAARNGQYQLGEQLAQMHLHPKEYFGWEQDNCIGATPQPNPSSTDWISFYRDHRLHHQFNLAKKKGRTFDGKIDLLDNLEAFFVGYSPHPSVLHGDLWGGNTGYTQTGDPFIFDPATYYGDRETDLAFTYMFGGFDSSFYQGYEQVSPLHKGFQTRKILYNLYHELNHFNLFGGGYANSAQSSINQLLKIIP